ncbi:MAG: hypothetical protein Q7P63_09685 [Verrucomicrobiota bacterium JB022]|nr:hypothetical protein [Verrucomicrobiota bacterium JB022]
MPYLAFNFEELLPVIFVILWVLFQMFASSQKKKNDGEEEPSEQSTGGEWAEVKRRMEERRETSEDEARRLQEELRRRYAEQRQERTGEIRPVHAPEPVEGSQRRYDPFKSDAEQSRPAEVDAPPPLPRPVRDIARERPVPAPRSMPAEPRPQEDVMQRLREQQQRIREAEREHQIARAKAEEISRRSRAKSDSWGHGQSAAASPGLEGWGGSDVPIQEAMHQILHDPEAARKGIVLAEIFGRPVALRGDTTDVTR